MKVKTKFIGLFLIMLALIVVFQASTYFITKNNVSRLEAIYGEYNERRLNFDARHLFFEKMACITDYCLFREPAYLLQIKEKDRALDERLDALGRQLRICGEPEQIAALESVREMEKTYGRQLAAIVSLHAAGHGREFLARFHEMEQTENRILSSLDKISGETDKFISSKGKSLGREEILSAIFPFMKPIFNTRQELDEESEELWDDVGLSILNHFRYIYGRRYFATGEARFLTLFNDKEGEFEARVRQALVSGSRTHDMANAIFYDSKELNRSLTGNLREAVRLFHAGKERDALAFLQHDYLKEEMISSGLHNQIDKDLVEIETAYQTVPKVLNYALTFNRQFLVVLAVMACLVFAVGSLVINRMVSPINDLSRAARRISAGDWSEKVKVRSKDEIGQMAVSFNKMIEDLEQAEKELVESHIKFKTIVDNVGTGISLVGPDFTVLEMNGQMRQWFEQIAQTEWPFCFSYHQTEQKEPGWFNSRYETLFDTDSQQGHVYYRLVNYPYKGEKGCVEGAVQIFEDITDRIQADIEKSKLMAELARSNRELQDFAYIASHDLQAPVRKIVSFSQLLELSLKDKLSGDDLENLGYLVGGATHIQRLINDLLEYSRVTTKGRPLEPVDLHRVLQEVMALSCSSRLEDCHGTLEIPDTMPWVMADQTQLYQLFQNLIDNALKYHRDGVAPRVKVGCGVADGMVRVEVSDNGIGIDEKYSDKVFKMFQRLQSAEKYEGSGIGLSICQRIVKRHGGDIGLHSTLGEGTTFWFTIMLADRQATELREAA